MAFETENIGADTWRFILRSIDMMTEWSLGQTLTRLEEALDECRDPEVAKDLHRVIRMVEQELDARAM